MQADRKRGQDAPPSIQNSAVTPTLSNPINVINKRKRQANEIDEVFKSNLGKKIKKAALHTDESDPLPAPKSTSAKESKDSALNEVLSVIRAAPKEEKTHQTRRHR